MGLFDRFAQVPGQAKSHFVRNGVLVLAVFGFVVYFMYTGGKVPFVPKGGYTVTADFATSANVSPGKTPVRVKGVNVGVVEKLKRLPGGRGVRVTMRIDDKGVKLRQDAGAQIYWRTLLGFAFYIELDQGSSAQKLSGPIPMDRTSSQVELDTVLQGITKPSREGVQTIFQEFKKGFDGKTKAGRSLDALAPAMRQIGPGLQGLRGVDQGDLTDTVRGASQLMGVLAKNEVQLGQVVENGDQTLAATARQRASIENILEDGPSTLDQTKQTVTRVRSTLDKLDPVADKLRPGVKEIAPMSRAVRPALDQLNPALDDARPTLRDLRPALRDLRSASRTGTPFLKGIEPTLDNLNDKILPGLDQKGQTGRKAYEVIGPTFAAVEDSTSLFDAYGYTQRFQAANAGARSLGFLPCSVDLTGPDGVKCQDLGKVVQTFLGGTPASQGQSPIDAGQTGSRSSSSSSAGGSGGSGSGAADAPASAKTVKQVTDYVQGVL